MNYCRVVHVLLYISSESAPAKLQPLPVNQPYTLPLSAHQTRSCATMEITSRSSHNGTHILQYKGHVQ